ncbi:MAG: hypothetical protein A3I66_07235 [Burkholderiales bacterium RIFCSPLOWO2_02_FULL_57_36]|nr:MAG: hypothetical protein A3I66_07235 [Burkholderiales bacterium RIFCSPLOWO2_02_FULL_57_36]
MLKFFFLLLLAANGVLFAYHQGHLEKLFPSGREPARIGKQINADKFKLVPAPAMNVSAVAAEPEQAGAIVGQKQGLLACTEIGNFTAADAKRFEARLAEGSVSGKLSRRAVQETSSHMIMIPPQEGKEGADKKAGELRKLGITDFYVIQDNNDQRWGISLGIFKTEEAARVRLVTLNQQGVRSARLIEYTFPLTRVAFQLRDLDDEAQGVITKIKSEFPRQEIRACE